MWDIEVWQTVNEYYSHMWRHSSVSQCPHFAHLAIKESPCSPDLTICPNMLERLQNVQLFEKWENKSLVSTAHWTDPWQFENSLSPLLFADFNKFLLHQAAQIQTDALLIYFMTWFVCVCGMMHWARCRRQRVISSRSVDSGISIMRCSRDCWRSPASEHMTAWTHTHTIT